MKKNIHIRIEKCTPDDVDRIYLWECWEWNLGPTEEQYKEKLKLHISDTHYKLMERNRMMAFAEVRFAADEIHLIKIYVYIAKRGYGYGKRLLYELIEIAKEKNCKKMVLEVNPENLNAVELYKAMGFKVTRIRENYYGIKDAMEMILEWE